jgi:tRNA(His) 5'-end guanylyltransferase
MSAWRRLTCIFPEDGLHLEWRVDILVDLLTDRGIVYTFGDGIDIFLHRADLFRQGGREHAASHVISIVTSLPVVQDMIRQIAYRWIKL